MGYYTTYELEDVLGADYNEVRKEIEAASQYGDSTFGDSIKWYECHDHLQGASKKFKDAIIVVSGVGEENGDLWKAWYKNGNMKIAKASITFTEPEW